MALRAWALAAFALAPILWGGAAAAQAEVAAAGVAAAALVGSSTADHSKFEVLKKPFASGPGVTQACLSCHTEASDQVMHTVLWQ